MHIRWKLFVFVFSILIGLHSLLRFTHEDYNRATSFSNIASHFKDSPIVDVPPQAHEFEFLANDDGHGGGPGASTPVLDENWNKTGLVYDRRANATFVILARNVDVDDVVRSVREIEDRFNRAHGYPYVFLNEEPFSEEFKNRLSVISPSRMEFGQIPHDHWFQPEWIDEARARASRDKMKEERVIYGDSVSYRNMCRFNSGFFFKHELMLKYRWYWRIEPRVHFLCNINFDPFLYMEDHDKIYGFTISLYEFQKTIPTLWSHVREFMIKHPEYVANDNALGFLSSDNGTNYNLCHFWSNFEIADMNFWRGEAYTKFFEYLDSRGGFYYERWGDAPVHSIAASIFARKDQIHFFAEIGYEHAPYTHCPKSQETWKRSRCSCDQQKSFDYQGYSCLKKWEVVVQT